MLTPDQLTALRLLASRALAHHDMVARIEAEIAEECERVRRNYGFTPFSGEEREGRKGASHG